MDTQSVKQLSLAKTSGQSFLALLTGVGDIAAGLIIATYLNIFPSEPWIIALYPGVLSMRGVIGGLFSGRLTTGLHLGTIKANLFAGESKKGLRPLLGSIVVLTFESSIFLAFVALLFGILFLGIDIFSGLTIFGTLVATMGLSLLAISPVTLVVAFSSFRKGLDPDIIAYPIVSTIADILVTLCYVLVLSVSLFMGLLGQFILLIICIVFAGFALSITYKYARNVEFARTIKEAIYTIVAVAFIVNFTGSVLSRISEVVSFKSEVYVVYPALLNTIGGFGAIVGSTATTKLALGTINSSFRAIRNHKNQIIGAWAASAAMFTIIGAISLLLRVPIDFFSTMQFIGILLTTNVLATVSMVFISFNVAILTFKKGLDPDNFVIPIESSLADTMTTIALFVVLSLIVGF
ncbi:MAG: magnesium transporter [Candidatus Bathyarchaeota archaeon]|nr:MAG: magnesium transporter [Candidatus Bathyarchaeota archaeon]